MKVRCYMLLHMGMLCGSRMQKKYILLTSGKKVHFASLCLESCHPPRVVYAVDKFVPRRLVVLLLWQPVTHLNFICLWDQTRRKLAMHVIVNMIPVSAEIACVRPAWESSRTKKEKDAGTMDHRNMNAKRPVLNQSALRETFTFLKNPPHVRACRLSTTDDDSRAPHFRSSSRFVARSITCRRKYRPPSSCNLSPSPTLHPRVGGCQEWRAVVSRTRATRAYSAVSPALSSWTTSERGPRGFAIESLALVAAARRAAARGGHRCPRSCSKTRRPARRRNMGPRRRARGECHRSPSPATSSACLTPRAGAPARGATCSISVLRAWTGKTRTTFEGLTTQASTTSTSSQWRASVPAKKRRRRKSHRRRREASARSHPKIAPPLWGSLIGTLLKAAARITCRRPSRKKNSGSTRSSAGTI